MFRIMYGKYCTTTLVSIEYKHEWYSNYLFYLKDTLDIWIMVFNFSQVANIHVDTAIYL